MSNEFFAEIYDSIKLKENQTALDDIESNVIELVRELLLGINHDKYFKVADVYPTGSYYERTKIHFPDEFDYMVVIDSSPFADELEVRSECNSSPWFQSIFNSSEKEVYESDLYFETRVKGPWDPEKKLWSRIRDRIQNQVTRDTKSGKILTKEVKHHKLYLQYTSNSNSFEIGVDLMLAFVHPSPRKVLENFGFPKTREYTKLLESFKCHLVPKSCHSAIKSSKGGRYRTYRCKCWFISFAAMETEMMKKLDDEHKKCYKVMKALLVGNVNYPGKCMNLSSYMLKSAFLYHVFGQKCCQRMKYESCIPEILKYLRDGFENLKMPCFFARDLNVWGRMVVAPSMPALHDWLREQRGGEVYSSMEEALQNTNKDRPIRTEWLDLEYDPTLHAKLWVELWRRIIIVLEKKLERAYLIRSQWATLPDVLSGIRKLIVQMLEQYSASKRGEGWVLDCVQTAVGPDNDKQQPFTEIPPAVRCLFPRYLNEWKKIANCEEFDIDELKRVDEKLVVQKD